MRDWRVRTLQTWRWTMVAGLALGLLGCKGERLSRLREAARAFHTAELSRPIPIFSVRDLRRSQRYFREVLGFKVDWEDGDPPDFGSVSRADAAIFMCQGCQGNPGAWVMIFSRDVDALYKELAAKKAVVKQPPTDMPWHLREMHVADPDGNVLRFATAIEH
jgi:catechol 2,3-dioxygenase-like lactoylglutathione lyase family enzyme